MIAIITAITALTRTSSVRITSRISMCSKSFETASCGPKIPRQNCAIAVIASTLPSPRIRSSSAGDTASIQRAAEARYRDRHGKEHQAEQRQRVILQVLQGRALQHDRAHDAQIMRQWQAFSDILRPDRHPQEGKHET